MKLVCPKNTNHKIFIATAHVTQDWEVDDTGAFLNCINDCDEVTHNPSSDDIFVCSICGLEAIIKK